MKEIQREKKMEVDTLSRARGALPDIPEINNYDAAYYHYALNIMDAASKS